MKLFFMTFIALCISTSFSYSKDFDYIYPCGGYTGGSISFDQEDNIWFTSVTGLYKITDETMEAEQIERIKCKNGSAYFFYDIMIDEIPPIVACVDDDLLVSSKQGIFMIQDSSMNLLDFDLEPQNQLLIYQVCRFDQNHVIIDLVSKIDDTGFNSYGLYNLNLDNLEWEHFDYSSGGRGYANYFGRGQKLYSYNNKIYYPGFFVDLTAFNRDSADVIDLRTYIPDTTDFNHIYSTKFYKDKLLFLGCDERLYEYNLETHKCTNEDISQTRIYTEHMETINQYAFTKPEIVHHCDDYTLLQLNKPYTHDHLYVRAKGSTEFYRIDIDTNRYKNMYNVTADKDNKIWMFIDCIDEPTGRTYLSLVHFDPLEMVSVEDGETINFSISAKVYPNPASKNVTVEYSLTNSFSSEINFAVYDYTGKKILDLPKEQVNYAGSNLTKEFDVSDLATGSYYLMIDNGIDKQSVSFVVE